MRHYVKIKSAAAAKWHGRLHSANTDGGCGVKIIARIHTDFKEKFGIPRQSGLSDSVGKIVFESEYRSPEALRGIEEFSHLWLIWEFSEARGERHSLTVRPPRLGGNKRIGVFATRSPYRPNPIGLSSVKLESVSHEAGLGTVLYVSGADMLDGTPIYDIKPYITYSDSHPEARSGFAEREYGKRLEVCFPPELLQLIPEGKHAPLIAALEEDPRPQYHLDERKYGMAYSDYDISFHVSGGILYVDDVKQQTNKSSLSN